ncbi:FliH/SctL family protein [Buchnera aphidicola]|uniref:FliH/SctL family protein n=1 Tax=Buchnera aphidicola TaxID=9 RepID=UPI003BEEB35C
MSKFIEKQYWKLWCPKKIFLKNTSKNSKNILYSTNILEKNLYTEIENEDNEKCKKNIQDSSKILYMNDIEIKNLKEKEYQKGFTKGCEKNKIILQNKIKKIFIDFENSILSYDKLLFSYLLKVILTVSAYIIGKNINVNKDHVLSYIKKIIIQDDILLKKPRLIIHPQNKKLVEKFFLNCINTYDWKLVYDKNIDVNGCKVMSDSGDIDMTIDARWQELCRLVNSKEYE